MQSEPTTIYVCTACRSGESSDNRPGEAFIAALRERLQNEGADEIIVTAVECLGVCKRPCTAALSGMGKWTYVVGDLDATEHVEDLVAAARAYAASAAGIVPWKERPPCFKKGVVSRTPPLGFSGGLKSD